MDKPPTFVGIDVSKDRLDVHARPSGESLTVDHDEAGDQGRDLLLAVADGETLARGTQVDVEPMLGDVDADEHGELVHDPVSLMRARWPW